MRNLNFANAYGNNAYEHWTSVQKKVDQLPPLDEQSATQNVKGV